ncbi:GTP-binding protein [Acidihalobacter ferrooxydans]|uniref:GTP-binding protein HSR1 n=1 Tax=Acidihalobacter ferrooxydans TaxID=1765967 RepID=A0A1P8UJW7_9GAMM|nr:GTP-binding protein [Acidihalobacter ferrooxydans]APZ44129.1 GTP-binding protein HSR1 [Acidihalobacter ferrooxydans]
MKIWKRVRARWPRGWSKRAADAAPEPPAPTPGDAGARHLALARESLRELLEDPRVPEAVRAGLAEDYARVRRLLDKLDEGSVHVAVYGRVSVGKSALLNALLGVERFSVSPLHGETRSSAHAQWDAFDAGGVYLIDTPGINEVDGAARAQLAREVVAESDVVLFVVDGDLTEVEFEALKQVADAHAAVLLVLNKADRYTAEERERLRAVLARRVAGVLPEGRLVLTSARPAERVRVRVDAQGRESESVERPAADIGALEDRLWAVLEAEGKTLAALNASLFAGQLSERVAARVLEVKRELGERVIRMYSLAKGVAVGFNPLPGADLVAAVALDVSMVIHLGKVYGLPMSRAEAGRLVAVIAGQLVALLGSAWTINLAAALLKLGSGGLSSLATGTAQGAVAWYATYVVGRAAERYLAAGKSWGEGGAKRGVREILDSLDRDSLLKEARAELLARLRRSPASAKAP